MAAKKKNKKKDGSLTFLLLGAVVFGGIALLSKDDSSNDPENGSGNASSSGDQAGNLPRGLKNNNPLNLILTNIAWTGKIPNAQNTDGRFEQFYRPEDGYRAGIKNIHYYVNNLGRDSIATIIDLWNEGPDDNYIAYVSERTGIPSKNKLSKSFFYDKDQLWKLVQAMAEFENGPSWSNKIKFNEFSEGFDLI